MITLGLRDIPKGGKRNPNPYVLRTLAEAAAWCSHPPALEHAFRSPELSPASLLAIGPFPNTKREIDRWFLRRRDSYRQAVTHVSAQRSDLLRTRGVNVSKITPSGKVLRFYPSETVADGAAEVSSLGFFDVDDTPPWDTWFCYAAEAILAWIPEDCVSRVQAGIDANPVDCIHWVQQPELSNYIT